MNPWWLAVLVAALAPPCRCGHSFAQHESQAAAMWQWALAGGVPPVRPCLARRGRWWRRRRCGCPAYMTQARFDAELAKMAQDHSQG